MWERLKSSSAFWIIEQGAEDAQLAADILDWCRDEMPEFFEAIHYGLIENSSGLCDRQRKTLEAARLLDKK